MPEDAEIGSSPPVTPNRISARKWMDGEAFLVMLKTEKFDFKLGLPLLYDDANKSI